MSERTNNTKPVFKGLSWYREKYFSFYIPIDWHKVEWHDGRQGIIYIPSEADIYTLFAVEVTDLGTTVSADDLHYLETGFSDAIKQLPERKIESKKKSVVGKLVQLEAKYTFAEDGQTRKRWVRVLYHETRQVTVTAQGATVEAYEYWLPMFYEAMMTVNVNNTKPAAPAVKQTKFQP
jgi:hypothetical protein